MSDGEAAPTSTGRSSAADLFNGLLKTLLPKLRVGVGEQLLRHNEGGLQLGRGFALQMAPAELPALGGLSSRDGGQSDLDAGSILERLQVIGVPVRRLHQLIDLEV